MIQWGPWSYNLDDGPVIGDYVQVETVHDETFEMRIFEGIFAGWNEEWIGRVVGDNSDDDRFIAQRWRRASLPEETKNLSVSESLV